MNNIPSTDVSSAQSFDVSSFLGSLVHTAGNVLTARAAPSQNTGQPAATTQPNLVARPGGSSPAPGVSGLSTQTMVAIGIGAALLVGVILLTRKA